jgi:prepilin-type N-terminal cleavage/methylation domain-containing protein
MPDGRRARSDGGFTLLEVIVAMAVISTMMLSLSPMFVTTMRVNTQQSDRQAAIQAADDAMERARAIQVSALLTGRDPQSTVDQAAAAPAEVKTLLTGDKNNAAVLNTVATAGSFLAWDDGATLGAGASAALPTTSKPLLISGVRYAQQWFIG